MRRRVFRPYLRKFVLICVNDIVVHSPTLDEHFEPSRKSLSGLTVAKKMYFWERFGGVFRTSHNSKRHPDRSYQGGSHGNTAKTNKYQGLVGITRADCYYRKFIKG